MGCSPSFPEGTNASSNKPTPKPASREERKSIREKSHENVKNVKKDEGNVEDKISRIDKVSTNINHTETQAGKAAASLKDIVPIIVKNDVTGDATLPVMDTGVVKGPFASGQGRGKWPIRNYAALNISTDAFYGGCAGLLQCSNSYGGPGQDTTAELLLYRSGFSGHHFGLHSLVKCNSGHFGTENGFVTDEQGNLIGDLMFGNNHVSLMSSDPRHGDLSHGLVISGQGGDGKAVLPLNVNGSKESPGAGNTLLICSGWESGAGDATFKIGVYQVRSGLKDNFQQAKLLCGEDKWKFDVSKEKLRVTGLSKSQYSMYHNRKSNINHSKLTEDNKAFAGHVQSFKGDEETRLFHTSVSGTFLVMCSTNSGTMEEATIAALYCLSYDSSNDVTSKFVAGQAGQQCQSKETDLWTFTVSSGNIKVKGPKGPCKYGIVSNIAQGKGTIALDNAKICLATGQSEGIAGSVDINKKSVLGVVNKKCDISIGINNASHLVIPASDLKMLEGGQWGFCHYWTKEEKEPGLKLIRVAGKAIHVDDNSPVYVDLNGSPRRLAHNFPGVLYALNCGGADFESTDGIIYESEFIKFANFSYDFNCGSRSFTGGGIKMVAQSPQLIAGTPDGAMFANHRTPYPEAVDEQYIQYKIKNIPNGKFTLRLNFVSRTAGDLQVNGKKVASKVASQLKKTPEILPGRTAHRAEIEVKVTGGELELTGRSYTICSFALLDKDFKAKTKGQDEMKREVAACQKLMDEINPLARTMGKKERKLVGWSPNLLKNASAELGNLSSWNIRGDVKVHEGGHGTEKAFITSHMWCTKQQTVDLLEHFSAEYLDTAPTIKILEWYREGVCGGGHYYFRAALLDGNGKTIKKHVLPETGRLYKNNAWTLEEAVFDNYGPGVRMAEIETRGKDDKHWGGHYGIIMSAAELRVQRETKPADDDQFADIQDIHETSAEKDTQMIRERESLISQILNENAALLQDLIDEQVVSNVDSGRVVKLGHINRPKHQKKREVRVFVSSTFRDFTLEREELIKKTFREINKMCVDRGVSFTYVDLRWGINEDQTQHGETIAICLREIDRCRPYFLCMMGERYGWSQREGTSDNLLDGSFTYAAENFPKQLGWVDKHRWNTSVTKLEILHGVLNEVEKRKERSFFYLRDPVKEGDVSPDLFPRMKSESEWHQEQQDDLRNEVAKRKELNIRRYKKHLQVCDQIKTDLVKCINEDFPLGTELTGLEREREAHIAFAEARRRVYIGREEYFTQINDFITSKPTVPLVILGESGSGKSALVANWVGRTEERLPDAFLFVHFIGSSAESSSYLKLLRRLYEELKEFYNFEMAIPQSDQSLVQDLPSWLKLAGSVKDVPCIIVFDALNQLQSDAGGAEGSELDLLWIPRSMPTGVTMILSTLPGRTYDAVERMGWPTMRVEPLQTSEKMEIVTEYLESIYGKHLSEDQKSLIVDAPQTNNPLYLKALLDEVRMFGSFRALTGKIKDYLGAGNPPELFAKILSRLEDDFETSEQSKGLVRRTTSAIWCSNKGMTESEMLALLDIPSPVWSPFYLSIVDNLVNRNGVVNFFHDHLRQAVEAKYLPTDTEKTQGHSDLADFFFTLEINSRVAEELPYALSRAGNLPRLKEVISKIEIFKRLIKTEEGKFDLIKYWTLLGDFNQVGEAYKEDFMKADNAYDSEELEKIEVELAQFFVDLGLFDSARSVFERLLQKLEVKHKKTEEVIVYHAHNQSYKSLCTHRDIIDCLYRLGSVCEKQKAFDEALAYYDAAVYRQRSLSTPERKIQLTEGLLGQASIYTAQGKAQDAMMLLQRCQELAKMVLGSRHHYVAAIMNKLGQLASLQGRVDEALGYYLQDLKLTRSDVGTSHPRVANILNDLALAYDEKNNPLAGKIYEAALYVLHSMYGDSHLDVACLRFNLGSFYFATNSFARGKFQFVEALKVYEQFLDPDHPDITEARKAVQEISPFVKM